MSNRLTFSLASLILVFALVFVAMPAMAHDDTSADGHGANNVNPGHPAVTISEASYPTGSEKARANYRVMVVATVNGSSDSNLFDAGDDLAAGDVTVRPFTGDGAPLTAVTPTITKTADKHEWLLVIDLSGSPTARSIEVTVNPNAVNGNRQGALGGSEGTSKSFTNLSPVLDLQAELEVAAKKDSNNVDIPGRYTLTLTFKDSEGAAITTDPTPEPTEADITISPMGAATAVTDAGVTDTDAGLVDGTDNDGIYTQDYQLTFGVTDATFTLISGYATNAPSATIDLDAVVPDPVYQNPPMVDLQVVEHDADAMTFQIAVSTTPALDTDGMAGTAIAGADIKAALSIMDGSTPPVEVPVAVLDGDMANERIGENSYRAVLSYSLFDNLPLTVSIDPNDLSDNANAADVAAVTKMVGTTPAPPNTAPVFTEGTAATRSVAEDAAVGSNVGAAVAATDADNDTLTFSLDAASDASFDIDAMGQITTAVALDFETTPSYTVTVSVSDGTDSASITVTISVTDVDETPPVPANNPPTLSISTMEPTAAVTTGSFSIAYSTMDADATDTVIVSAVIKSVNPPAEMANYSVAPPADGMVVITQAAPTATTMTTPGATVIVTLTANDGTVDSAPVDFTVSFAPLTYTAPNMDPVFATGLPATITGKSLVPISSVTFSATDADGGTLAYSWDVDETALGLKLDTVTGTVSGTPNKAHSGSHPITVVDGQGGSATHALMITISGNTAPEFSVDTFAFPALTQNMAHPVTLPGASDADMDTLTYSIRGTLPSGLTASTDGSKPLMISGAASTTGTTSVVYVVSDGRDGEDTLALTITVSAATPTPPGPPAQPTPPVFGAPLGNQTFTEGTAITPVSLPKASGGTGTLTYSLWVGLLDITDSAHNGLSLDKATQSLVGTPTAADAAGSTGTTLTWRVTDANNLSADLNFTVVVKPKPTEPPKPTQPTVIGIAKKSTNLDRIGTFANEFKIAPNQGAFELTLTHKDPRNLISIWLAGRDYDRNNISFAQNTGTPTSWTLRIAVSNPNPVRSFWIEIRVRNSALYQLATPDPSDPTKNVNINRLLVQVDNEGPRVLSVSEYQLIPAAGGPFEVSILFNELLKAAPVAGNFAITNGTISDIRLLSAADQYGRPRYLARITPAHGVGPMAAVGKKNVELRLNSNLADKYGNMSLGTAADALADAVFVIKKATTAPPTPPGPAPVGTVTAALSADETTTTISAGRIAANGFAVIDAGALPDLEYFFDIGGTIGLSNGDATDDKNSRTVVMSEILWGLDLGAAFDEQQKHQFIELYNTTGAEIDLAGWTLTYTEGNVRPAIDIDQVSNRGPGGWEVDTGDTGKSGRVTGTLANDPTSTITPVDIVSMYRNINYTHVEKEAVKATVNRGELVKGIPGGNGKGSWKNSTRRSANKWIKSTPGAKHHATTGILTASNVSGTPFRINEIGNDTDGANDWVELHNHTDAEASLKNYSMSIVTAQGTDTMLFHFHDQDWKVPAKGYVVISTRHPRDTDLAAGKDLSIADDQEENRGASHLFVVKSGWNLKDDGKFTLILRNNHEAKHLKTGNHLVDVVATRAGSFAHTNTSLWPLAVTNLPHENVIDGTGDEDFRAGRVYQRNSGTGRGEKQFALRGFTGIGYDRAVENSAANGGTPGYDNGAVKEKIADLSNAEVSFSEIMLGLGDSRQNLPQWIEIYNSSMTQAAVTNGWKLHVENTADVQTALDAVLNLDGIIIPPNQTVLIVTNTGRVSDPDHFPSNRVVNLWTTKKHRDALEMIRRTDQVFSTTGLYLKLTDKDNKLVDEFGNLDGNRRTRDELANTWAIPMNGTDDERRSSLIRVYDAGVPVKGTMAEAWVLADETNLAFAISETYYGDPDDYGTPGFRAGGPLPVSLSKFRPERLDDGSIRIVWITESELNNAGFNILRSEKRDGEYKQINTKLIAGQGTTSERTTYTHVDASAKPNVVYYYQIQDVSLDGKVQTLRLSRLKGNVSAEGKLTTTWGELKALQ